MIKGIKNLLLIAFLTVSSNAVAIDTKPCLANKVTDLTEWQFAKLKPDMWCKVTVPHSCNAIDGRSAKYYRGKSYYRKVLNLSEMQIQHPLFLIFEGAAQTAFVKINGKKVCSHRGGYTPFVVTLNGNVKAGDNEIIVLCNNKEDVELIPVSSDFNKNNGLHNPVHLLEMNQIYASPVKYGMYRMHISTPQVSEKSALTNVQSQIKNSSAKAEQVNITLKLVDATGKICYQKKRSVNIPANSDYDYQQSFTLKKPHLWQGVDDPYLYQAQIEVTSHNGEALDKIQTTVGYRFYHTDAAKGFFLNGKSYPLRGVSMHQDWDKSASALSYQQIDKDYEIVKELGANFLRLAHYPHNDYAFRKCDELGIIVETEIPWVNVCGVNATPAYFENIHSQMKEMITNLYNHPSICFWGMWNELANWGNDKHFQGKIDTERIVKETGLLYDYAKTLDPYRLVGETDCTLYSLPGYTNLKGDFHSENLYCGWYGSQFGDFMKEMEPCNKKMGVINVSEYGAGINPFCHSLDPITTTERGTGGSRHDEEYGDLLYESHVRQIQKMPYLNFTSLWILFDFPVADRLEGYMDTDDGVNFVENDSQKYMNDKGLVTRDRVTKKDVFYLYKSLWNKKLTTVYITSRRFTKRPADKPLTIKVYSNAKSLTLYQNGKEVETLKTSGESSGVVWTFAPIKFQTEKDDFKVAADDGTTDTVSFFATK
jgi:hypothetical protein